MIKNKTGKFISNVYLIAMLIFMYLPIIYMCVFSFNSSRSLTRWTGFSTQWYERLFSDYTIGEAVYYTVLVALLATIFSTIIGTITAIGLSKSRYVIREIITNINDLPMMNPDIVTAIGMTSLFLTVTSRLLHP